MLLPVCLAAGVTVTPENLDRQLVGLSVEYMRLEPNEDGDPAHFWFTVRVTSGKLEVTPCTDGTLTIIGFGLDSWLSSCQVVAVDEDSAKSFRFGLQETVLKNSEFRVRYQECGASLGRASWTIDLSSFVDAPE